MLVHKHLWLRMKFENVWNPIKITFMNFEALYGLNDREEMSKFDAKSYEEICRGTSSKVKPIGCIKKLKILHNQLLW